MNHAPTPRPRWRRHARVALVATPAVLSAGMLAAFSMGASADGLGGTPITGQPLRDPPVLASRNGTLTVNIDPRPGTAGIGGRTVGSSGFYNGNAPAPTLVVSPGDHLRITTRNGLGDQPTNLHLHGMHLSPVGHGDNVFVNTPPGSRFVNQYVVPDDQPPGLYWYHPHRHMYTQQQVWGGMAGAIVVRPRAAEQLPASRLTTHLMAFQQFQVGADGQVVPPTGTSDAPTYTYVNGQLQPVVRLRPGQYQRWELGDFSSDSFLRVQVPAGIRAWVISRDGVPTGRPIPVRSFLLSPGNRQTLLVRGGRPGTASLQSLPWGSGFQATIPQSLVTIRTAGAPVASQPLPQVAGEPDDLRRRPVERRRTFTFSEDVDASGNPVFFVNGKTFDQWGSANAAVMKLGTTEEWTLLNPSFEVHPFHIHVQPFQVLSINGVKQPGVVFRDTVMIPAAANGTPGKVVIRQRYTDFTGRFVFHCHILFHEDHGMMAPVKVVA